MGVPLINSKSVMWCDLLILKSVLQICYNLFARFLRGLDGVSYSHSYSVVIGGDQWQLRSRAISLVSLRDDPLHANVESTVCGLSSQFIVAERLSLPLCRQVWTFKKEVHSEQEASPVLRQQAVAESLVRLKNWPEGTGWYETIWIPKNGSWWSCTFAVSTDFAHFAPNRHI